MSIKIHTNWTRSSGDFISVKSGDWNDPTTWNIVGEDGELYECPFIPGKGNDVFLQNNFTVYLTSNSTCKTLAVNSTEDVLRLSLNNFILELYGQLDLYTGSYSNPTYGAPAPPIASPPLLLYNNGGEDGRIKFVGSSTRILLQSGRTGANLRQSGLRVEVSATGINSWQQYRLGHLILSSGDTQIPLTANTRLDNTGVTNQTNGSLRIKSGAKFDAGIGITRSSGVSNLVESVVIESGGEIYFRNASSTAEMSVATYDFSGQVSYIANGNQSTALSNNTGSAFSASSDIIIGILLFGTSGNKTLATSVTITNKLIRSGSAVILLNSKTISYGLEADLEITTSMTRGNELPSSGSGTAIPNDLILADGVVYNLGGATVNIRGVLVAGAGASVTNGTLNENQS